MTEVPRRCPSIGCWEVVQGTKTLGGTNRGTEPRARCVDPGHTVLRIGQLLRLRLSRSGHASSVEAVGLAADLGTTTRTAAMEPNMCHNRNPHRRGEVNRTGFPGECFT